MYPKRGINIRQHHTYRRNKEDGFTFLPRGQDGECLVPADDQPCLFPPQTHVVSNNTRSWKKSNVGRMKKNQFLIVMREKNYSFWHSVVPETFLVGGNGVEIVLERGHDTCFLAHWPVWVNVSYCSS